MGRIIQSRLLFSTDVKSIKGVVADERTMNCLRGVYLSEGFILDESATRPSILAVLERSEAFVF